MVCACVCGKEEGRGGTYPQVARNHFPSVCSPTQLHVRLTVPGQETLI